MHDLQEVFNRIQVSKKKGRELTSMYKEALGGIQAYQDLNEKIAQLRAKKRQIEIATWEDFSEECKQIDAIKVDVKSDAEMLTDIAITKYTKGESIEITDEYENKYEPRFSVRFSKKKE